MSLSVTHAKFGPGDVVEVAFSDGKVRKLERKKNYQLSLEVLNAMIAWSHPSEGTGMLIHVFPRTAHKSEMPRDPSNYWRLWDGWTMLCRPVPANGMVPLDHVKAQPITKLAFSVDLI